MAKNGLEHNVASRAAMTKAAKKKRDDSLVAAAYRDSLKSLSKSIASVIKETSGNPALGIDVSKVCTRLVMDAASDPAQDQGRALFLRQCDTLERYLALVRKPAEYLAAMRRQFGPNLDPRNYSASDSFNTIIKSQRRRLSSEGQGFNTQAEKDFCRKRSELLAAVEKSYNRLRDQALELPEPSPDKSFRS